MSRKLIIGYQATGEGRDALALGGVLAETLAATPLVAMVMPWPEYLMPPKDLQRALEVDTAGMFATARDRLAHLDPETVAVANHSPAQALYELAEEEKASLVVIGSAHRGTLGRVLLGSMGVSLLHGAPCGIAVAPRGYAERSQRNLLRVGVAFDGSSEAWSALETGIGFAARLHASFTVLTVAEPLRYRYGASLSVPPAGEYETYEQEEKRRALGRALASAPDSLPVEGRLLNGDAGLCLTNAAKDLDLLVLGSRGYGPLRRTLLGSVAAKVMRSAECPVLVLPRGTGMDPLGVREADTTASKPHRLAPQPS